MRAKWRKLQELKGKQLIGIEGSRFQISKVENALNILCPEPFIHWRQPESIVEGFWRLEWIENQEGDDILILHEQETLEPLEYGYFYSQEQKYPINESSYFNLNGLIKEVCGYGFIQDGTKFLTSIVLEFEKEYICIQTMPVVMEIKVTDNEPEISDQILFSTKKS
jgi:hypothetical protein